MLSIWGACRALSNGHDVYNIKAQQRFVPPDSISWAPLLPMYWKIILPIVCFAMSSIFPFLVKPFINDLWEWGSWSVPVGILSSFAVLHSGLFGTLGLFRLTGAAKITDTDQLASLVSSVSFLVAQYGTQYYRRWQGQRLKEGK